MGKGRAKHQTMGRAGLEFTSTVTFSSMSWVDGLRSPRQRQLCRSSKGLLYTGKDLYFPDTTSQETNLFLKLRDSLSLPYPLTMYLHGVWVHTRQASVFQFYVASTTFTSKFPRN